MSIVLNGDTGITTPGLTNTGTETIVNLTTTGNTTLGDATTDTLTVGVTGIVKDASGNVGIGTASPSYKLDVQNGTARIYNSTYPSLRIHNSATGTASNDGLLLEMGGLDANIVNYEVGNMIFKTADTERMRIDSSGNVGIGTSSPVYKVDIQGNTNGQFWASIKNTNAGASAIGGWYFGNDTYSDVGGVFSGSTGGGGFGGANSMNIGTWRSAPLTFFANNAEKARITTNNFLVNTTTTFDVTAGAFTQLSGQCAVYATGSPNTLMSFYNSSQSARVGFIGSNGNTTSYNSGSDYRLKENITNVSNAISKIEALRPVTFNWKVSPQVGKVTGFIAHELAEIYPEAVTGEKDAMCDDGVTPNYQMVDQSKLVPLLTAAIQEQQALITALTERIEALENK